MEAEFLDTAEPEMAEKIACDMQETGSAVRFGCNQVSFDEFLDVSIPFVPAHLNQIRLRHGMVVGNDGQRTQLLPGNIMLRGEVGYLIHVDGLDAKLGAPIFDVELDATACVFELFLEVCQELIDIGLSYTAKNLSKCAACKRLRSEEQRRFC